MYYSERVFLTTSGFALAFTATNLFYIRKNYFANLARARLLPTFKYWALINFITIPILLRPLTMDEMKQQWRKRLVMGKYLYTLYHMESPEQLAARAAAEAAAKES